MSDIAEIFISYAWSDQNNGTNWSPIIQQLYSTLSTKKKYSIKIDIKSIGYKDDIKKFMKELGKGKYIIVEISEKYLKSKNCMFEAVEMLKNPNFNDRIFPILTEDAQIYQTSKILEYIKFWDAKIFELNNEVKSLNNITYAKPILEDIELFNEIRRVIAQFGSSIGEMNVLTPEIHKNANFDDVLRLIDKKIELDQEEINLKNEIEDLQKKNLSLQNELDEFKTKFAESILDIKKLKEQNKDLENEINELKIEKDTQDISVIENTNSDSLAKNFINFLDFNPGDKREKVLKIFGSPNDEEINENYDFDSLYYEFVDFTYVRKTSKIQNVSIFMNNGDHRATLEYLISKGIKDDKIHYLGKHESVILSTFGKPYSSNSGNHSYWFDEFVVTFICYDHDNHLCSKIDVQHFNPE